ncbi:MAG: hypothetical protein IJ740_04220 [Ruminococcus sp.]|nr:hypothetical protein [Ruminococcus sp.]
MIVIWDMKRKALILSVALSVLMLAGCGSSETDDKDVKATQANTVSTTAESSDEADDQAKYSTDELEKAQEKLSDNYKEIHLVEAAIVASRNVIEIKVEKGYLDKFRESLEKLGVDEDMLEITEVEGSDAGTNV